MQRFSEPQLIAAKLDETIPAIIRIFNRDGIVDAEEMHALQELRHVNTGQHRQAQISDLMHSIERIGLSRRNEAALIELFPELGA